MKEIILQQASYNLWANSKFAKLVKELPAALLEQQVTSSFPSLLKTLFHIWDAEYIWMERLAGKPVTTWPGKNEDGRLDLNEMLACSRKYVTLAENSDDHFLRSETLYKTLKGDEFSTVNYGILFHVFNHGTFHRGQIVTMLRNVGYTGKIESTDLISYLREGRHHGG